MTDRKRKVTPRGTDGAKALIRDGYYQVSRKFRIVARLPDGLTGIQALARAAKRDRPDTIQWARLLGEASAGDHFLRVYAPRELWLELDEFTFAEFLRLGGTTYQRAHG